MVHSVRIRIYGRVQGVGFRYWTARQAEALGLSGWVRNDPDGLVSAAFFGSRDAVNAMLESCRSGPEHAKVSRVEKICDGIDPAEPYEGFDILR